MQTTYYFTHTDKKYKKSMSTQSAPKNPHSSHNTANIKSVRHSGKKRSLFCVPRNNPLPLMPPDPTAIVACSI